MKNYLKWERFGNFFLGFKDKGDPINIKHQVSFMNCEITPILRAVRVVQYSNSDLVIYLTPSPFFKEKLLFACFSFFKGQMDCLVDFDLMLAEVKDKSAGEEIIKKYRLRRFNEHAFMIRTIILFKFENQFFLYSLSPEGQLIKISDIDKFKKIEFDAKNPKILLSSQIPKDIYNEIVTKFGPSILVHDDTQVKIELKTVKTLFNLFTMFNYFNQERESVQFPKELISELKNICLFNQIDSYRKHIIPSGKKIYSYVNPDKKDSLELIHEFKKESNKFSLESAIEFLGKGYDPNSLCEDGELILTKAIKQLPVIVLKWLTHYGAKPFLSLNSAPLLNLKNSEYDHSDNMFFSPSRPPFSPMEEALIFKRYEHLNYIITSYSKFQKSPSESKKFSVKTIDFLAKQTHLTTLFHLDKDRQIIAILKPSTELSELEKKQLYELFSIHFNATGQKNEEELKAIFNEDVLENKLVELIYDPDHSKKMVGFNAYEVLKDKNIITLHIVFTALLLEYRGTALISYLVLVLLFILALVAPNSIVGLLYTAISPDSYRITEDFLHFPKYSSAWNEYIKNTLMTILDVKELPHFKSGFPCYVEENVRVKEEKELKNEKNLDKGKSTYTNFKKEVFYKFLGISPGSKDSKISLNAGVPVYTQATTANLDVLCQMLEVLNINLISHLFLKADVWKTLLCKWIGITSQPLVNLKLYDSVYLFFKKEEVPVILEMQKISHSHLNSSPKFQLAKM